jgi:Flp pilus assembly protein TadB
MRRQRVIRLGIAVAAGLGTWLITGWPVGGVAAGCAAYFLPSFFTVGRQMERRIERLEALEEWVRRLADSMAVGSAPIATIVRSAARAPEAIRPEVSELAQRLDTARWDRSVALHKFADRIDDSLGDLIALALEIAVSARASERVPGVLRQMADAAAEEVKARRQIEVERAAPRNEARILVLFNVAVMVVVAVFTDYTAPYNGPLGQAFLAILMLLLTGCIWLLRKYSLGEATPRILTNVDGVPAGRTAVTRS